MKFLGRLGLKANSKKPTERDLILRESKIGSTLLGQIPEGHRREFFCLDDKTWVWHEEWMDEGGRSQTMTTRYEVRPNGVMKIQDGHKYTYITGQELHNLANACKLYYQHVTTKLYKNYINV